MTIKSITLILFSQLLVFGTIDRIQKAIEKKEYEKVLELIQRGYEKDPYNAGISYYYALLLFTTEYSSYDPDSARVMINKALKDFNDSDMELKEDLKDEGITEEIITQLGNKVRDQIFQRTLSNLTLTNISAFRQYYPGSIYEDILIYKKDSIEFDEAINSPSELSLTEFIDTHPTSIFSFQADSVRDDLRYEKLIDKGTLEDYYGFLKKYPLSRYEEQVERYIFKVSTASHNADSYVEFLQLAQTAKLKKQAADILFDINDAYQSFHPNQDSILRVKELSGVSVFPVVDRNKVGFYDTKSIQRIDYEFDQIPDQLKCEIITDSWIFGLNDGSGAIKTKSGSQVLEADDYQSIGRDLAMVKHVDNWYLYHKSGFQISKEPIENAELLDNKWIKIKKGDRWGLITYLGIQIAELKYEDIYKEGVFWVFKRDGLLAVYTEELILEEIEDRGLSLEFKFDDIEPVNQNMLIGFRDDRECLLDSTLNFLVPWGEYEIHPEESGWYLKSDAGYQLYNSLDSLVINKVFPYIESNKGWLALKMETDWLLLPKIQTIQPSREYDSIKLINDYAALLIKEDVKELLFRSGDRINIETELVRTFPNRPEIVSLTDKDQTRLFNPNGKLILEGTFDKISFVNDSLFKVEIKKKQGLKHINGDWILNPVFETLDEKNGLVITLYKGKIGCYDPSVGKLIRARYESRVSKMGENYLAMKDGSYGLIDVNENIVLNFTYSEILHWNDTSYLVKEDDDYLIINKDEEEIYESMESVKKVLETSEQKVYQFIKNGKYGLVSSKYGELLDSEFTDIFNIGSKEKPLFFADQHLDKAGYHVVSYIDGKGDLILSKAYTKDEFEQILCDN